MLTDMLLTVHLKPSAKQDAILAWLDETTLKATVCAPPEKGKANRALIKLLADYFKVPKLSIEIVRGKTTRMKQVELASLTKTTVRRYSKEHNS